MRLLTLAFATLGIFAVIVTAQAGIESKQAQAGIESKQAQAPNLIGSASSNAFAARVFARSQRAGDASERPVGTITKQVPNLSPGPPPGEVPPPSTVWSKGADFAPPGA